jgi:hypothetical protein
MTKSPILFLVFNRPSQTRKVFESIRAYKPEKLYISADGPRVEKLNEKILCNDVRSIIKEIDWECQVSTLFNDTNLGCKNGVANGINWFFKHEEYGIILEDDCMPIPDFFIFCDTLLEKYKNDDRIWMITGNNFQNDRLFGNSSYYFSKYCLIWGWATWRRAWEKYDLSLSFWVNWKDSESWKEILPYKIEQKYWSRIFEKVYNNQIDTWDYSWVATVLYNKGLVATPNKNLVSNIGFGPEATHTKAIKDIKGYPTSPIGQITHPEIIQKINEADKILFYNHFGGNNLLLANRFKKLIRKFYKIISNK